MQMMWKVNGVSVLYAFSLFMQMELLMNVYRLERVTGIAHMDRYVLWRCSCSLFCSPSSRMF